MTATDNTVRDIEETNMSRVIDDRIPTKEKWIYGSAEFYGGGYAALIGVLLLAFMTKSLGIAPAIAGTIVLISKAWDAISDPLMGVISDNTRTRWGRRRPWIVIGGALIPFAFMMMFAPIQGWGTAIKIAYATIGYIFLCTVNTVSQVPYCTMSNEISPDFKQRNTANAIKVVFSMIGAAVCYLVPNIVFNSHLDYLDGKGGIDNTQLFLIVGVAFGLAFAIPVVLCGLFSKERVVYDLNQKSRFSFRNYIEPLKIKSFRYHLIMYTTAFLCADIISAILVYYARDVLQGVALPMPFGNDLVLQAAFLVAPLMVMAGLMYPVVLVAMHKKSKQFAFRMGLPFYVLGGIVLAVFPRLPGANGANWILLVSALIMGIGFGGAQTMPWMIFPDAMDVAELKTGKKDTGTYSGLMTFARKFSTALAIWLVGIFLDLAGYDEKIAIQPLESSGGVFIAVRVILGVCVTLLITISFIFSVKYKVTDKKLARIKHILDKQKAGEELTEEELTEKQALIDELA